jgi:hypothetical protein
MPRSMRRKDYLLAGPSTRRRFNANWKDITGRAGGNGSDG